MDGSPGASGGSALTPQESQIGEKSSVSTSSHSPVLSELSRMVLSIAKRRRGSKTTKVEEDAAGVQRSSSTLGSSLPWG